jgi:2-amino-4-hydroxy-6-hydroxymethyldihydropteridine diphosphokinase
VDGPVRVGYCREVRYWIGLGSNLGDRLRTLRTAAKHLEVHGTVLARSRVFASSPVGGPPQPPFLNAAIALVTDLAPLDMLAACQSVERALGRSREGEVRWGPRTLDLDLLLAGVRGEMLLGGPDLELPHPRLHERAFALATLVDLEPGLIHPARGRPLKTLLAAAQAQGQACAATGDLL